MTKKSVILILLHKYEISFVVDRLFQPEILPLQVLCDEKPVRLKGVRDYDRPDVDLGERNLGQYLHLFPFHIQAQ